MKIDFPKFSHPPIDIHTHFNHGVSGEYDTPAFAGTNRNTLDFFKREYTRFGIREFAASTYAAVMGSACVAEENDYLHALARQDAQIFQWVVLHPEREETFAQAERMLTDPRVLGLKIHPQLHGYRICEHADRIFSFADRMGATVLMHPAAITEMPRYADRYPNMRLIIAHLAEQAHIEAIRSAKHGNIYTDTSGALSMLNSVIEYAVEQVGSEKILFGTDTYALAAQYSRVALADIPYADKENILFGNAVRLFPHAFGK